MKTKSSWCSDEHIKERFKDHVATYEAVTLVDGSVMEYLKWQKPGTGIDMVRYFMHRGYLMVNGDLYDATYSWHWSKKDPYAMKDVADTGFDYFFSKLRAGMNKDGRVWDDGIAEKWLNEHYAEEKENYAEDHWEEHCEKRKDPAWDPNDTEYNAEKEKASKAAIAKWEEEKFEFDSPYDHVSDQFEWVEFVREYGEKFFGGDWWDFATDIGQVADPMLRLHHMGLKMAMASLDEEKKLAEQRSRIIDVVDDPRQALAK